MQTFYRYTDAHGRLRIVDSLSEVPEPFRARAERIEMDGKPQISLAPTFAPGELHAPSFLMGFGAAAALAILVFCLRGNGKRVTKLAVGVAVVCALAFGYFGLLRRATGTGGDLLSSPTDLIDDARRNVDALNARQRQQEAQIDEAMKAR